ncbi:hypothetical protein [Mesorhizobium sp.]|nr:hypothetical protein [Mesorhizobium sp.]
MTMPDGRSRDHVAQLRGLDRASGMTVKMALVAAATDTGVRCEERVSM